MKKIIALLLALAMCLGLCACGGGGESAAPTSSPSKPDSSASGNDNKEDNATIEVDENLLTVEITIPASFYEDMSADEIMAAAKEEGYTSCNINSDGSVTYTMTKAKHKEVLEDYAKSAEETIAGLLDGENEVASFESITHNDDFSEFEIIVNDNYSTWDALYVYSFYALGAYYQVFSGVEADKVDVLVTMVDTEGNEQLSTSYREFMDSNSESETGSDNTASEEPAETVKPDKSIPLAVGETVLLEDKCEFFVDFHQMADRIMPPQPGSWYSYYDAEAGKTYIDICISYKNLDASDINADEVMSGTLVYGGKYEYEGFSIIEEDNRGDFTYTNITSISPLTTEYVHYLFAVPDEVETSDGALWAKLVIGGNEYKVVIREGVEGEVAIPTEGAEMKTGGSIADGNVIVIIGKCEFYVDFSQVTDKVMPPQPGDWYSYYEAGDGKVYVDVCVAYRNLKSSDVRADKTMSAKLTYADKYEYSGFIVIEEDSRGDLTYSNITDIAPLCTEYLHYLFEVPAEVANTGDSISIALTIEGNTYTYTVR